MNNLIALSPTSRLMNDQAIGRKGAKKVFDKQFFLLLIPRDHNQIIDAYQQRPGEVNMVQCARHSKCTSSLALSIVFHTQTHSHNRSFYTNQPFSVHPVRKAFFQLPPLPRFASQHSIAITTHIMIIEECIRRRCSLSFN